MVEATFVVALAPASQQRLCLTLANRGCVYSQWLPCLRSGPRLLRLEILVTTQQTQPENNDTHVTVVEDSSAPNASSNASAAEIPASPQDNSNSLFAPEAPAPSFTALIEEFRQREDRMASQNAEPADVPATDMQKVGNQEASVERADAMKRVPTGDEGEQAEGAKSGTTQNASKPHRLVPPPLRPATRIRVPRQGGGRQRETFVTQASSATASSASAPLASTAKENTEHQAAAGTPVSSSSEEAEEAAISIATTPEATAQEAQAEQPKPARRYRFDRREPAAVSSKPVSLAPSPAEPAGVRPRQENIAPEQSAKPTNSSPAEASTPVPSAISEPESVAVSESEVAAPAVPTTRAQNDRRRRHSQEGQQPKPQTTIDPVKDAVKAEPVRQADAMNRVTPGTPAADQPVTETASDATPLEDLPPLEYSELQAASRRRRRRRPIGNGTTSAPVSAPANKPVTQPGAAALSPVGPTPITPVSPVTPTRTPNVSQAPYTIQSGMTVSQMNQGNDAVGPFQGPEPSPARGSVLPQQPRLTRSMRNGTEAQRGSVSPLPAARSGDGILSVGAVNHLANVISQAIQTQSDRLVTELRHANQAPANVSVTLPPFPSTERVGVFVDVANLLYSARTLRTTIDFGKLLDFLRGNRRLVRAHAYCPTSPQLGDDQMFLQAVKGLGYRMTTKNYKTFASGAKKADMDLDLCMDVVRLVDGKAVDCIVLVSGDSDFIPLLDYCSDHGVRVEVVAFDESMSASLRQSCDLFINLSMLDEIRVS